VTWLSYVVRWITRRIYQQAYVYNWKQNQEHKKNVYIKRKQKKTFTSCRMLTKGTADDAVQCNTIQIESNCVILLHRHR